MAEVVTQGAGEGQIQGEKKVPEQTTEKKPEEMTREDFETMLAAKIEENNRKWQSKFDTVLGEKKTVETKALTVEQRMEQLERERAAERLGFARERARLGAKIDDDLDGAIRLYGSSNADEVAKGADAIRAYIEKLNAAHDADKQKAVTEALAKAGAQPTPKAGDDKNVMSRAEWEKLPAKDRADYMARVGALKD